ncbi:MAG: hypothetical protein LBK06_00125 [Planctomycetaceae bacterium]|nr:hypothetical protein [Planctomycetaceae bacterium]
MTYSAQAVLKFSKLNTAAQQREAVVQGRSLPPIPASVSHCRNLIREQQNQLCIVHPNLR